MVLSIIAIVFVLVSIATSGKAILVRNNSSDRHGNAKLLVPTAKNQNILSLIDFPPNGKANRERLFPLQKSVDLKAQKLEVEGGYTRAKADKLQKAELLMATVRKSSKAVRKLWCKPRIIKEPSCVKAEHNFRPQAMKEAKQMKSGNDDTRMPTQQERIQDQLDRLIPPVREIQQQLDKINEEEKQLQESIEETEEDAKSARDEMPVKKRAAEEAAEQKEATEVMEDDYKETEE